MAIDFDKIEIFHDLPFPKKKKRKPKYADYAKKLKEKSCFYVNAVGGSKMRSGLGRCGVTIKVQDMKNGRAFCKVMKKITKRVRRAN